MGGSFGQFLVWLDFLLVSKGCLIGSTTRRFLVMQFWYFQKGWVFSRRVWWFLLVFGFGSFLPYSPSYAWGLRFGPTHWPFVFPRNDSNSLLLRRLPPTSPLPPLPLLQSNLDQWFKTDLAELVQFHAAPRVGRLLEVPP